MKKLLHILLLFIIWIPGVAQVYNMGNLSTITDACGGLFYDSQGPNAQYLNSEFSTVTFCAPAGQVITFTFTDFATEAGWDYLDIYNGPTTASPLFGSYTGNVSPGVVSSAVGGCLTFQFSSDGGTRRRGWEAAISCGDPPPQTNNGDSCPNSSPFCTGTTYTFNNNINVPSLGAINCLGSSPNPVWYYFEIENPGDLTIDIAQYDVFDFPIDVDFLLWGPFTSLPDGCTQIQNSTAPVVDCSFSGSAFEQAVITGAQAGEVYILLLTNYENDLGYITFNSTAGSTATTNCDILCSITALSATPTACDPTSNTYEVSGELTVTNPPESGILTFTSSCGGTTTVSAPFGSQISYTISGINAAGGSCNVVASFSADPSCTITESYTAPAACATVSLNCPDYANASTSPTTACSNQTYYLDVANTACAGQIFFTVAGNYGSLYGDEISWTVSSNLTGATLASGTGNLSGANFSQSYGPFNPTIFGTIFTLNVDDLLGDGFDGVNGQIYVTQGANIIGGPIAGEIGFGGSTIFGANISISPATITVTTPAGNVVQTVQNCNDFRVPISIENPNFCNTINATLPWTVTCNSTGATLASGSNTLTVYPTLPSSTNDVVSIQYNTSTCDWEVTGNNDCDAGDIGTIFTISPNPNTLSNTACTGGTQTFDVTYIGVGGGPNCCSTGGTLIPIQINDPYAHGSYVVASSPFGGINNAAYLNIPPNTVGGNATSLQLDLNMSGFCMDPAGPNAGADLSYWVTVVVDGQIISDFNTIDPGPSNYSQSIDLADIPGGFNSSMDIEVYIYPNVFANAGNTVYQTFNPSASCASLGNGIWTASSITANLAVTFEEFEPTAASCLYPTNAAFSCCSPTTVSDASSTICSGGSTAAVTTWQNAVAAANPTCVVYSSVLPVAGTTLPNNTLPNGINATASPIIQTVSAYAYCDADGSSTINSGDTYTLISTYSLTVNPNASAGSNGSTTICTTGSSVNLFSLLGGTPANTGTWSGPSALSGGNLGTFNPASNTAGVYTYTVAGTSPCPNATATVTVTLSATPTAAINYAATPFCKSISTPQSVVLTGTTGGTYTSSPAGLTLNASSGAITPSSSTAGTYTVTYTVPAAGGCPGTSANTIVEIVAVPDVATNLPSYSTCTGPTLATAGAYTINITSTSPGASFNWSGSDGNSGTGTPIDYPIANNTCTDQTVTFTITSTVNGCTSTPINRVLTLRPKPLATFTVSPNPVCLGSTATVTFTGTSCPGSAYNWTWPAGVNVLSGSGAGPYTISFSSAGLYNIRHQIIGPASLGSCTSPQVTVPVTVVDPANAGTNGSTSLCNTDSPVDLFSLLGGTPANTGTWSGPSALSGGNLGTFNPASNTAGVYTYTVAGTSPCPNATATVAVTLNTAPSASITYTGSPFCTNLVGTQSVSLSGTTGGTFSSTPSGLSINPSTGAITASTSTPGTYTITYTIASAGGCAAFSTSTTVVITSAPSTPGLTPALPCEGEVINFTASGGSWYSFTVNGVELQAPSADNTYTSAILAAGDEVCVQSYPVPPFVFNGQISEPEWGNPLSTSTGGPASSFGGTNNLDALYLQNMSGNLYGALAGQTQDGSNNRFLLFIDCIPGGFNSLSGWTNRTNAPYWSMENLSSGINFDAGFNPDYILAMNQAFGLGFFDLYNMQTNNNLFLGQTGTSEPLGYQNNGGSGNFTQGYEFAISLDKLGNPTGSIQVFAMLVNDPGSGNPTFVSNQFLSPAGPAENSYGNSAIFFGSAQPNPISYALSADCSNETCVTVTSPITPTFSAFADVCEGGSVPTLPTTSNNSITGTWSPSTVSNTASGSYTFTPTAGLCADPVTVNITVTPRITPTFNPVAAICSGDALSALPTTSTNGITGTWSPALNNTATTLYTFTPSGGQCASTTTLTITVNPIVTPTFNPVAAICSGDALSALPTTSTNGITGTWSPALNNTATTLYTFTPSGGQCASTTTLTITVNPIVTPTFNPVAAICSGDALSALPTTSTNGITGTWSPALNNTATTLYTFTPSGGQCASTTTLTITVNPIVTPTFNPVAAICSGDALSALPTTSTNGITGTWSPALNNTATTLYTFTPSGGQCASTTTLTITVNPIVTPTFNPVAAICSGDALSALPTTSTNGITGTWSPALNNTATTLYTFTPSGGQCASTTTLTITVNPIVTPTFNAIADFCSGTTSPLLPGTSLNGISGTWSPAVISNTASGTYTFTPNAGVCADQVTITVNVTPRTVPTFSVIPPFCEGTVAPSLPATSNNGISGTWSPSLISNTAGNTYNFTPNAGQCADTGSLTTTVLPNPTTTPIYHD